MQEKRAGRREFLGALGTVAAAGLAGCSAVFGQGGTTSEPAESETTGTEPTESGVETTRRATGENGTIDRLAAENTSAANASENAYTRVYQGTIESVVLITVETPRGIAEGTGFVYDDSHVVTNAHVVENARSIRVRFSDEAYPSASVVGTDVSSDLAVLETDVPDGIEALSLHESQPAIGTKVLAIGNPFGRYDGSASAGIVSGVNRSLPAKNGYTIPDAIQTDAAVNPGNSGGPLMNLDGEVLGVVNSGRRQSQNIGFAISAALVSRVVPALIEDGEYAHAYMGVKLATVTPSAADQSGIDARTGVLVSQVRPGGPADGTLRVGDVIVRMGQKEIESRQELSSYLALRASPGDTVPMRVIRNGTKRTVRLTLGSRPESVRTGAGSAVGTTIR